MKTISAVLRSLFAAVLALLEGFVAGIQLYPNVGSTTFGELVRTGTMIVVAGLLFLYLRPAATVRSALSRASFAFAALWLILLPVTGFYNRPELEGGFIGVAVIGSVILVGVGLVLGRNRPSSEALPAAEPIAPAP